MDTLDQKGREVHVVKTFNCILPSSITSIVDILSSSGGKLTLIPFPLAKNTDRESDLFSISLSL
jgi:hypothetical protein